MIKHVSLLCSNRWHETDLDLESRCESTSARVYFIEKRRNMQAFCTLRLDHGSMMASAQYVPEALVDVQLVPMEGEAQSSSFTIRSISVNDDNLCYVILIHSLTFRV